VAQQTQEQTREAAQAAAQALAVKKTEEPVAETEQERESVPAGAARPQQPQRPQLQFDDDDLDIPDFLK
jgi:cell division protein FtsZ